MVRTQVQLSEGQIAALKSQAILEGVSMAELIRRGVDLILESSGSDLRADRVHRAIEVAGRFRSGLRDLSSNHDKYAAEVYAK